MTRAVVLGVTVAVGVAGCGGNTVAHSARVSGVVKLCGGVGNKCYAEPARVSVLGANNKVVAGAHTLNGRFSFGLQPGIYKVSASVSGHLIATVSVNAVAGRTTRANIIKRNVLQ